MPYGEKSAYAAQAALKKKSPAYMKSSGFKMKGSPLNDNGKVKSVISPDGNTMTKSIDGKVVSTFTRNPNKDFKSGKPSEQSKESWIRNE